MLPPKQHVHSSSGRVGGLLSVWEKRSEEANASSPSVKKSSSGKVFNTNMSQSIKICLVGNSKCGKTSLILSYREDDRELPHTTLDELSFKSMFIIIL